MFKRVEQAKECGGMEAALHKDRRRTNPKSRADEAVNAAQSQANVQTLVGSSPLSPTS